MKLGELVRVDPAIDCMGDGTPHDERERGLEGKITQLGAGEHTICVSFTRGRYRGAPLGRLYAAHDLEAIREEQRRAVRATFRLGRHGSDCLLSSPSRMSAAARRPR